MVINFDARTIENNPTQDSLIGQYSENFLIFFYDENADLELKIRVTAIVTECVTTHA